MYNGLCSQQGCLEASISESPPRATRARSEERRMQGYLKPQKLDLTVRQSKQHFASFCGLCQALREEYGVFARFLVNHDGLFLQLLAEAQQKESPKPRGIRCGVKPIRPHEATADPSAVSFAAAISILTVDSKLRDVSFDATFQVLRRSSQLGRSVLKASTQRAEAALVVLGFSPQIVYDLLDRQDRVEQFEDLLMEEYAEPTAEGVGALAAQTAIIAQRQENETELRKFGHDLGALLYLLDAVEDIDKDIRRRSFNPLLDPRRPIDAARKISEPSAMQAQKLLHFWYENLVRAFRSLNFVRHAEILSNIIDISLGDRVARALTLLADLNKRYETP